MQLSKFLQTLGNKKITGDEPKGILEEVRDDIDVMLVPIIEYVQEIEATDGIKTSMTSRYTSFIMKNLDGKVKRTFTETLNLKLVNIKKNLKFMDKQHSKIFASTGVYYSSSLSATRSMYLAHASLAYEFVNYSAGILFIMSKRYMLENKDTSDKSIYEISRSEEKLIERNAANYIEIVNELSMDTKDFANLYSDMPDVEISESNAAYADNAGLPELKIQSNFLGGLIFTAFKWVPEWQAKRYKRKKDQKKVLELTVMDLESSKDGKNNAAVQKEIEYTNKRIDRLDYDINEYEEDIYD